MKKIILASFIFALAAISSSAQTKSNSALSAQTFPENLKSDGCTHFPNGDYLDCCVQHDLAYFKGGSWKERWRADGQLRKCVAAKNGWWHKPLAPVMWSGVRIGGVPFLPTKFRWGFGQKK
ncbi:MAG: FAD-binding oxidoreductase [Pyrinomonadaceae bacterium]